MLVCLHLIFFFPKNGEGAFFNCDDLVDITLNDSLKIIKLNAFNSCGLTKVKLPDSLTILEERAFVYCSHLQNLIIPTSVKSIGVDAFDSCNKFTDVYYTGTKKEWDSIAIETGNENLTEATFHYNYDVDICTTSHTFTSKVTKEPTYIVKGARTYTCSVCGYSYYDSIATKTVPKVTVKSKYTSSTSAVRINWKKVSGATGYRIYRYNSKTKRWIEVKTINNGSTTTYKQTGLKAGTTYKYRIKAYVNYCGIDFWSTSFSSTIKTTTKPAQVTMKTASKTKTAVRINWKKVTGANGYQVQRYNSSTKKWVTVKTIKSGSTLTYKQTGLKKGTAYKYRVRAYRVINGKKVYGTWSKTKKVTTKS
ncbi:MAG: fibronectin type III domain-containing protein [Ruminococcus sp.]|nr:fibronectin type III domain-containing protein [Ruminococcus sp.]